MRFLFTTIQGFETEFYGRVGTELVRLGHETAHVSTSRIAASRLRSRGIAAHALPEIVQALGPFDHAQEADRIAEEYALASIRDLYWADPASTRLDERRAVRRAVEHVLAFERLFADVAPEVVVPEVGRELPRTVAHAVASARGVRTFFLFYTIFPQPLRLYVDTMHAPIVAPDEVRPLTEEEREAVERFRREFLARAQPIRAHRSAAVRGQNLRRLAGYVAAKVGADRDNEYLDPLRWTLAAGVERVRRVAVRPLYEPVRRERPFVYFPLHDTDDYKIKQVIPHFADQAPIVEQIADALPPGHDLVIKEHPQSLGQNALAWLHRLRARPNVRLVHPMTNTHELIRHAAAVAVISSTVGLEALLHDKPVLTLGRPFYAGLGATLDLESPAELRAGVAALLRFRPDPDRIAEVLHAAMVRCRPGKPVLVDSSDENACALARSLAAAAAEARPAAAAAR